MVYYKSMKKTLLAMAILFAIPTLAAPHCVVVHDRICFESQAQYDKYMGWGPEQQKLERNANK
jgi:hypothetical protein